jgi:coenzyme F420 biosynthesis associated uncharacterized protein
VTAVQPDDRTDDPAPPGPVDWALAERVARRFAGREPLAGSYLEASLDTDFQAVTREAEHLVADFTGLRSPQSARAAVLDRGAWIEANVASMRRLLAPLTDRVGERVSRSAVAPVGRRVAGTEMGVLLGYLSQRVLGQYDLLVVPDGPDGASTDETDAVYYVGSNILVLEKRYAFAPREFRRWIALHEVTHRAQFTGVPWLKGHFLSLVEQAMTLADPDPRRLAAAMGRAVDDLRRGRSPLDDGGLVALLASPEQRGILDQVQALMTLLEGHGNRVMNELGREHVAGQARMARVLQARRRARGLTGVMHRLLGLESKLRQYEVGEAFIAAVEAEAGPRAIDAAWRGPEQLPTAAELAAPSTWLERVGTPVEAGR